MMTRTKRSLRACAYNLPVATALRVRCVPTARKEKWPLVSYSYSGEKNMKRYRWQNGDRPLRPFRRSMPCELGVRHLMLKGFGGAPCAERGTLGLRKRICNKF